MSAFTLEADARDAYEPCGCHMVRQGTFDPKKLEEYAAEWLQYQDDANLLRLVVGFARQVLTPVRMRYCEGHCNASALNELAAELVQADDPLASLRKKAQRALSAADEPQIQPVPQDIKIPIYIDGSRNPSGK